MHPTVRPPSARARRLSRPAVAAMSLVMLGAAAAAAGPGAPPAGCPQAEDMNTPVALRVREMSLRPGGRIDPAAFMRDPELAGFAATMTKHAQAARQTDWSGLCRYRTENARQAATGAPQTVFLGDSITESWRYADSTLFSAKVIDRGISGQTSSQILLRFQPDVVALRPAVVHIMAGTNDILQDDGIVRDDDIVGNIAAMIDIATANRIRVVLASIPPISVRAWQPALKPAARVRRLNDRLRELARRRGAIFVDYHTPLADKADGLRADLGNDGIHPNRTGYAVMRPLAVRAIAQAAR